MSCANGCFEAQLNGCDDIIVRAAFTPLFPLYWQVTKVGSSKVYQRLTQTNADGDLVIAKDDLPDGFLIPGRQFNIKIRDGNNFHQPILFVFGDTEYGCIVAEVMNYKVEEGDNSEVNVIQLTDGVTPADPSITFIANEDFEIPLTDGQVLDYVSLRNATPFTVLIGTTPGGNELAEREIDNQPILLTYQAVGDTTIYVTGIQPATTVKIKKS